MDLTKDQFVYLLGCFIQGSLANPALCVEAKNIFNGYNYDHNLISNLINNMAAAGITYSEE